MSGRQLCSHDLFRDHTEQIRALNELNAYLLAISSYPEQFSRGITFQQHLAKVMLAESRQRQRARQRFKRTA
ncbi:MAG TPA: hypothetical protein VFI95_00965 [Terriglobales bacterium]|nr:hypothetical protein [Terriglobales bacterium]